METTTENLISKTQKLINDKDLENPLISSNIEKLFNIFYGKEPKKEVKYTIQSQTLTDDFTNTEVGRYMRVDWLGYEYLKLKENRGSAPGNGQDKLMDLMVSTNEKGVRSKDKFVRGHLLNEELSGKGEPYNLFPITGYANSQHLHSTEKFIKDDIAPHFVKGKENENEVIKKKKLYAKYEVKVQVDKVILEKKNKITSNYINSTFFCKYLLMGTDGKVIPGKGFESEIKSEYHGKKEDVQAKKSFLN
jgi:hypothetical protein